MLLSALQISTAPGEKDLFQTIEMLLNGEFDNFQQTWQENTSEEIHRVEVEQPHQHIHTMFLPMETDLPGQSFFRVRHYKNRDTSQIIGEEIHRYRKGDQEDVVHSERYALIEAFDPKKPGVPLEELVWKWAGNGRIEGTSKQQNTHVVLSADQIEIQQKEGVFANVSGAYHLKKCRFFSGWIEYPLPEKPDSTFRMGNLTMHDQGSLIALIGPDGKEVGYSVELTQLVYGKEIAVMKLAIYEEPNEDINYNSRAISYTWTNPEAKRIGINLRKIVTGWTLIEPGYVNSDNMDRK